MTFPTEGIWSDLRVFVLCHLIASGRVFRVDGEEGNGAAFCYQCAVVLGCKPDWEKKTNPKINVCLSVVCVFRHVTHKQPIHLHMHTDMQEAQNMHQCSNNEAE